MKTLLIIIGILLLFIVILFLILKSKNKKLKDNDYKIKQLISDNNNKQEEINKLQEEIEIERNYKKQLAKKIADISVMSIDDVLAQLQND